MARWSAGVERVVAMELSVARDWNIALELCGIEGFVGDIFGRGFSHFIIGRVVNVGDVCSLPEIID